MKNLPPLHVEVTRGNRVESRHSVDAVIADASGNLVRVHGEAERPVFPRSAIKALQALALVESGAADRFGLEPRHIALACASHNGEEMHVRTADRDARPRRPVTRLPGMRRATAFAEGGL